MNDIMHANIFNCKMIVIILNIYIEICANCYIDTISTG